MSSRLRCDFCQEDIGQGELYYKVSKQYAATTPGGRGNPTEEDLHPMCAGDFNLTESVRRSLEGSVMAMLHIRLETSE